MWNYVSLLPDLNVIWARFLELLDLIAGLFGFPL